MCCIAEVENRMLSIRQQKISEENVYEFLLMFDKLYDRFTDAEKKEFLKTFVEQVDLYEEEQPDEASLGEESADVGDAHRAFQVFDFDGALHQPHEREVGHQHHALGFGEANLERVDRASCLQCCLCGLERDAQITEP